MKYVLYLSFILLLSCSKQQTSENKEQAAINNTPETQPANVPVAVPTASQDNPPTNPNATPHVVVQTNDVVINETELELEYDQKTQTYLVKRPRQLTLSIQRPNLLIGNNYLCYQLNYFREFEERINQARGYVSKLEIRITQKTNEQTKLKEKLDQQWRTLVRRERSEIEKRIERLTDEIEQFQGDLENANYRISTLLGKQNESKEVLSTEGGTSQVSITPNYKSQFDKIVAKNPGFRFNLEGVPRDLKAEFSTKTFSQIGLENFLINAKKIFGIKNRRNTTFISQIPENDFPNEKVSLFTSCLYESTEGEEAAWEPTEKMEIKIKLDF